MHSSPNSIALFYDSYMLQHRPHSHSPERPDRLKAIIDLLEKSSLHDHLQMMSVRKAETFELERVHDHAYIERAEQEIKNGSRILDDPDTTVSSNSWDAALMAAGASIGAVEYALSGPGKRSFAVVRPPGHHARPAQAMGFCILNNVAVAAAHALAEHKLKRILIVDIDVHHGNGTEEIFYENGSVLFVSLHQPAYPFTGAPTDAGSGEGEGKNINILIPCGSTGNKYMEVLEQIIEPAAAKFQPELVLVSAGFDAHWRSGQYVQRIGMCLTSHDYYNIAVGLANIADKYCEGRIAGILEGGYDLDSLAHSVEQTLAAWLGLPAPFDPVGSAPSRTGKQRSLLYK
jgi:acetoin utilization deacetylase AcuC-like enzyme